MSHNLVLKTTGGESQAPLFQTPSSTTREILKEPTLKLQMKAYLAWVDGQKIIGPGAYDDHAKELALWVRKNPKSYFASS